MTDDADRPTTPTGAATAVRPSRWRRSTPGLRARSTIGFAVVAAIVAGGLAALGYRAIADDVITGREDVALRQAYANARIARARLLLDGGGGAVGEVVASLASRQGTPAMLLDDEWISPSLGTGPDDFPASLLGVVADGHAARQRVDVDGELSIAVGIPLPAIGGSYYELVAIGDVETTLSRVRSTLVIGALGAVVASGLLGAAASGAALRPLRRVADAARTAAAGDLDVHVPPTGDDDLDPVVEAFNSMVSELRERLERDARFASDVTHELRGPLATLAAAADHARRHADDPAVVRESLDLLSQTVERFNGLVVDLLEISRLDAGAAELNLEPVDVAALVRSVVESNRSTARVTIDPEVPRLVPMDKRRIGRALANLVENADRYAGGATAVTATVADGRLLLLVDDAGPGIPEHERSYVLGRFARGAAARDVSGGTGLGLALVTEHLRLHGGEVRIEDSPDGGARMVLDLPLEGPPS